MKDGVGSKNFLYAILLLMLSSRVMPRTALPQDQDNLGDILKTFEELEQFDAIDGGEESKDTVEKTSYDQLSSRSDLPTDVQFLEERYREILSILPDRIDTARVVINSDLNTKTITSIIDLAGWVGVGNFAMLSDFYSHGNFAQVFTSPILLPRYISFQSWNWGWGLDQVPSSFVYELVECSGDEFEQLVEDFNMRDAIVVINSSAEMRVTMEKFRLEAGTIIGCVAAWTSQHREAAVVESLFEELVDVAMVRSRLVDHQQNSRQRRQTTEIQSIVDNLVEQDEQLVGLDQQLDNIWSELPAASTARKTALGEETHTANVWNVFKFFLKFLGAASASVSTVASTVGHNVTSADVITRIDLFLTTGAVPTDILKTEKFAIGVYLSFFISDIIDYFNGQESPPACGLVELGDVISEFQDLADLKSTFGSLDDIAEGSTQQNTDFIQMARYRVRQWGREMRLRLHCLVGGGSGEAYRLRQLIGTWGRLAQERLDITEKIYMKLHFV